METQKAEQMYEAKLQKALTLAESWSNMPGKALRGYNTDKHINFLEGIEGDWNKAAMAQLFENTKEWMNSLDESTRTLSVGSFEKFVFPLIRAVIANLVTAEMVSVMPLDAPTGLVFYFDALYGSQKGKIQKGGKMFDSRTGPSKDLHYTDEIIEEESIGTGAGSAGPISPVLAYSPVRPGTLTITDGTQVVTDDGNGALAGDGSGTINYATGAVAVTFTAPVTLGDAISATYEYNSEANQNTPEIDLQLTSSNVVARTQKLRARWSIEAQQDFEKYHGINAEVELIAFMANVIAKEMNYKIIQHIRQVASAGTLTWDMTPPTNVPWIWHKESLYDAMIRSSNLIFDATQRVGGTWINASVGACNVIETLSKFKAGPKPSSDQAGVHKVGQLGAFDVFKDPTLQTNEFIMGHKGNGILDTGYIWAPYLAAYTTGTIVLDDMVARKGMASRSAQKIVNSRMFMKGSIHGIPYPV